MSGEESTSSCDAQKIFRATCLGVGALFTSVRVVNHSKSLHDGLGKIQDVEKAIKPLVKDLAKKQKEGGLELKNVNNASMINGVATTALSAFSLIETMKRLDALKDLAKETKGLEKKVERLEQDFQQCIVKVTKYIERMEQRMKEEEQSPGPFFFTKMQNDMMKCHAEINPVYSEIKSLLDSVKANIEKVKDERVSSGMSVASNVFSIASNIAYGTMSAVAVIKKGDLGAGLAAGSNLLGAGVACTGMTFDIVNLVKCTEILDSLKAMEASLEQMKAELDDLRQRAKEVQAALDTLLGDDDLD